VRRLRTGQGTVATEIWRDPSRPARERVDDLLGRMTLEEKVAQLTSIWIGNQPRDADVAPMQGELSASPPPLAELIRDGLGQVTRVFGTRPVPPAEALGVLRQLQLQISGASRFGIPAVAHEECLTGFAAWTATVFPTPLAWGASFDPQLVREVAAAIGSSMRSVGIHQGLAPVLDVARDVRWGRTEETIGEDPYLVGSIGTGYVRGLQSAGVQATLKHFAGYSASRAGRNLAPVSMGPRELADVILMPFEMALRLGGARAVMPSYTDVDGVPVSGDRSLLTGLLRDELGFDGVVVSDYFAISFLQTQHGVAGTPAQAAALALDAGLDVELPTARCYGPELVTGVREGLVPAELIDRAAARVLRQKCDLGLLDPGWSAAIWPVAGNEPPDLDPLAHRALARRLAEESVVLLANRELADDGPALPLRPDARIAVIGPLAHDPLAFFGCYSLARHLGDRYPEAADDLDVSTVVEALRAELPGAAISCARGCEVRGQDRSGFAHAAAHAREADVVVAVLGDEAGLFGRGTSGEGCDVADLRLPGVQDDLLRVLVGTGTPVVLVLVTGRPYAIGHLAGRLAAAVQAFFPGQEGGGAIAGVLSGRVVPSGRLPVEMPRIPAAQPSSYLRPRLAGCHPGSSVDPTPLFAFGHGLSYTSFEYADLIVRPAEGGSPGTADGGIGGAADGGIRGAAAGGLPGVADRGIGGAADGGLRGAADGSVPGPAGSATQVAVGTDGAVEIACTVRNTGTRPGTEVVQLYLSDPLAQVVRPVRWLAGFARVPLDPGQARQVTFWLHADRTAFCGRAGIRVVEPGEIRVAVGGASDRLVLHGSFTLHGTERPAGADRVLDTPAVISGAMEPVSDPQ
jgi:beta-xylosidase